MRPNRLLIALTLLVPLALASPAAASDWTVDATPEFTFTPELRQIEVGDKVTWNFLAEGHTSASVKGQPDSWNSSSDGSTNPPGSAYPHTFNTPGRYQYVCTPHQTFM